MEIERQTDFWNLKPELALIANAADSRGVERWAVLGVVLRNVVSWLPPHFVLADKDEHMMGLGDAASLNVLFHIMGESNDGKSVAVSLGDMLMPPNVKGSATGMQGDPEPDALVAGTGEGLMKHFVSQGTLPGDDDKPVKGMVQHSDTAVVTIDEVSAYVAELTRQGSKAAGFITSVWSGVSTGSNTGSADSRTKLPKHSARLALAMLGQYGHVSDLFTDYQVDLGAPHRANWLPSAQFEHDPLSITPAKRLMCPRESWNKAHPSTNPAVALGYVKQSIDRKEDFPRFACSPDDADLYWFVKPPTAKASIAYEVAYRRSRGMTPAEYANMTMEQRNARRAEKMTGHALLATLKNMVIFGVLFGHWQPDDDDFFVAQVLARVSLGMLVACHTVAESAQIAEAQKRGVSRADELDATETAMDRKAQQRKADLRKYVMDSLIAEGTPQRKSDFDRGLSKKKREELREVLDFMVDDGAIGVIESGPHRGRFTIPHRGQVYDGGDLTPAEQAELFSGS
ncbi:hypothetical protein [Mycolicibacterium lutetiense]|uniref:DUF3987 domain-containing protein n=1 Tax=Mycolicibacterium lutetiense TaxID=1641992 RepID=A0ABS4ZSP9_9MYCO|nr:hypothetical protein [Mycolicibacterium lutetiense]MBP2452508.1 hypothetical protein [Mycolicibacterium lutetiense]